MAKLNVLLKLSQIMHECQPTSLKIIWADSLTKYEQSITVSGLPSLTLEIPFLAGFISTGTMRIELPAATDSTSSCPLSVKLYSTLGGISLYDVIENLHNSGNSSLVRLLKNVIKIHDIRRKCKYVVGFDLSSFLLRLQNHQIDG